MKYRKFLTVRKFLLLLLLLSSAFSAWSIFRKVTAWGFSARPDEVTRVWTVEVKISFDPVDMPLRVSMAIPTTTPGYRIESVPVQYPGYTFHTAYEDGCYRAIWEAQEEMTVPQTLYWRFLVYDTDSQPEMGPGRVESQLRMPESEFSAMQLAAARLLLRNLWERQSQEDWISALLVELNREPPSAEVATLLPVRRTREEILQCARQILAVAKVPSRVSLGLRLSDARHHLTPEPRLEALVDGNWQIYHPASGRAGAERGFILFRRGGESLIDLEGGENCRVLFAVANSRVGSYSMADRRVGDNRIDHSLFDFSIYNLPLNEQRSFQWLSIIPLAILLVVLLRNVVGIRTMGTFAPILLAMALAETGLVAGLVLFVLIVGLGLGLRTLLARLKLLLVPRIAAVVIAVILIMEFIAILGSHFGFATGVASAAFPIIIMAWIIERAAIVWEEDGAVNAMRQIGATMAVTLVVYGVIDNVYIRHVMFVFNELNLVVLVLVMLLGTYTGFRLTELKRFRSLAAGREKAS